MISLEWPRQAKVRGKWGPMIATLTATTISLRPLRSRRPEAEVHISMGQLYQWALEARIQAERAERAKARRAKRRA